MYAAQNPEYLVQPTRLNSKPRWQTADGTPWLYSAPRLGGSAGAWAISTGTGGGAHTRLPLCPTPRTQPGLPLVAELWHPHLSRNDECEQEKGADEWRVSAPSHWHTPRVRLGSPR